MVAQNWLGKASQKFSRAHMQITPGIRFHFEARTKHEIDRTSKGSWSHWIYSSLVTRRSHSHSLSYLFAAWLQLGWQGRGESPGGNPGRLAPVFSRPGAHSLGKLPG